MMIVFIEQQIYFIYRGPNASISNDKQLTIVLYQLSNFSLLTILVTVPTYFQVCV